MRDVLDRLLGPQAPPRSFAVVREALPDGRYRVADEQQRMTIVDGAPGYLPGAQVIIIAGRIVGTGSRNPIGKTVRV